MPPETPSPWCAFRKLACTGTAAAHDLAAEGLADGLMAKADAEDRNIRRSLLDQIEADTGLVRCTGPGDSTIASGLGRQHVLWRRSCRSDAHHVRPSPPSKDGLKVKLS